MKKTFQLAIYSYILKYYNHMFDDLIKKENMTQIEIDILAFLHNNPEYKHAQDIVNIRGISKAHASIAIDKLVHKGYIQRIPDNENRRTNNLYITDQATEIINKIVDIQHSYNSIAFKDIDAHEKEILNQILRKIYKNLGGYLDE